MSVSSEIPFRIELSEGILIGGYPVKKLSRFGKVIVGLGITQFVLGIYLLIQELDKGSFAIFGNQSTIFIGLGIVYISIALSWLKK